MKYLVLCLILLGCQHTSGHNPRYSVGVCVVFFDPETGRGRLDDIARIEKVTKTQYIYRWWVYQGGWAIAPSEDPRIGNFEVFERMTRQTVCPSIF